MLEVRRLWKMTEMLRERTSVVLLMGELSHCREKAIAGF